MIAVGVRTAVAQVVVEAPVGRFVAIALRGAASTFAGCSSFDGLVLSDVQIKHPFSWFPYEHAAIQKRTRLGASFCQPPNSCNLLAAAGCDVLRHIHVERVSVAGRCVRNDADFGLRHLGNVQPVLFDKCHGPTRESLLGRDATCACA